MTCKLLVESSSGYMSVNGQACKLNMTLSCRDNNIIYVAQCKFCLSGFYFGQTWLSLSNRMNNHRAGFKKGQHSKSALALHIFESHNDKLDDKLDNFNIGIILKCNRDSLNMHEDIYIEKFKARIIGLNRCKVSAN